MRGCKLVKVKENTFQVLFWPVFAYFFFINYQKYLLSEESWPITQSGQLLASLELVTLGTSCTIQPLYNRIVLIITFVGFKLGLVILNKGYPPW